LATNDNTLLSRPVEVEAEEEAVVERGLARLPQRPRALKALSTFKIPLQPGHIGDPPTLFWDLPEKTKHSTAGIR
jgi:hypothetical protein